MAVEVLAGPAITHGGTRVRVASGNLHVAQIHASVKQWL